MKLSLLELHDKVSKMTIMLDSFMKEIKGMVVEEVDVEEEEEQKEEEVAEEEEKKEEKRLLSP